MKLPLRTILESLRRIGFLPFLDHLNFYYHQFKYRKQNNGFKANHPEVKFPPDYMMYESFGLNAEKYFNGGLDSAKWLINLIEPHFDLKGKNILDWGCGPGRIVRHLPALLPNAKISGTDYNSTTIKWCKDNIDGVEFELNQVDPPTNYPDNHFHFIYGISIFTHLSEQNHTHWYEELIRVAKQGGMLLLTTQGDAYQAKMTNEERQSFQKGELVIRGNVKEGHRIYSAFHPPKYVRQIFTKYAEIIQHIPGKQMNWGIEQDVWMLKKK